MRELENANRLLTVQDVARILGISDRTVYNRVRKGAERPFPTKVKRIGNLIRFDPKDVKRYIANL